MESITGQNWEVNFPQNEMCLLALPSLSLQLVADLVALFSGCMNKVPLGRISKRVDLKKENSVIPQTQHVLTRPVINHKQHGWVITRIYPGWTWGSANKKKSNLPAQYHSLLEVPLALLLTRSGTEGAFPWKQTNSPMRKTFWVWESTALKTNKTTGIHLLQRELPLLNGLGERSKQLPFNRW